MNKNQFLMVAWAAKAAHFRKTTETNFSYETGLVVFESLGLPNIFILGEENGYLTITFNTAIVPIEWEGVDGISGAFSN